MDGHTTSVKWMYIIWTYGWTRTSTSPSINPIYVSIPSIQYMFPYLPYNIGFHIDGWTHDFRQMDVYNMDLWMDTY